MATKQVQEQANPKVFRSKFPLDHKVEILRKALFDAQVLAGISPKAMIARCPGLKMTERTLQYFISGKTVELRGSSVDILTDFWVKSIRGRALRAIGDVMQPAFLQLVAVLGAGQALKPAANVGYGGRYYLYHGSYMVPDGLVIRAIEVESAEGQVLLVKDHVRDTITKGRLGDALQANGVMTFEGDYPQILLHAEGEENKRGLSLVLFDHTTIAGRRLERAAGALIVLTTADADRNSVAVARRCLLVRESAQPLFSMMMDSKIISSEKLSTLSPKHQEAFRELAEHGISPDPVLGLKAARRKRSEGRNRMAAGVKAKRV